MSCSRQEHCDCIFNQYLLWKIFQLLFLTLMYDFTESLLQFHSAILSDSLTSSIVASQTTGISYSIHPGSKAARGPFPGGQKQVLQAAPLTCSPAVALTWWLRSFWYQRFLVPLLVQAPPWAGLAVLRILVHPFIISFRVLLLGCFHQSLLNAPK